MAVFNHLKNQVVQKQSDRRTRSKPRGGVAALRRTRRLERTAARWLFFNNLPHYFCTHRPFGSSIHQPGLASS